MDERSAGFIAMGMAQASGCCVALICTSGSALANFYPAVVEAYYQRIPMLVLSADRPAALIDQWDGQTIRQNGLFGSHVKDGQSTPEDYSDCEGFSEITGKLIHESITGIPGPVHLNVPLHEPLYPAPDRQYLPPHQGGSVGTQIKENARKQDAFPLESIRNKKVLVIRGMNPRRMARPHPEWNIHADMLSGSGASATAPEQLFLSHDAEKLESLRPDILLTDGMAVLSKPLKQFLRKYKPAAHFHFSMDGEMADPFGTGPKLVRNDLDMFLEEAVHMQDGTFVQRYRSLSGSLPDIHTSLFRPTDWNEFTVVRQVLSEIPEETPLHVSNSMPVRYLAWMQLEQGRNEIYANRGTSGIDGCVSTAFGIAGMDKRTHILFCGDVAFFYDSNAFWNRMPRPDLKVILLNNAGGGIFRLIDGPSGQPELEDWFETRHQRTASALCDNLELPYFAARNRDELNSGLTGLLNTKGAGVLEVFTDPKDNQNFFTQYKRAFNGI